MRIRRIHPGRTLVCNGVAYPVYPTVVEARVFTASLTRPTAGPQNPVPQAIPQEVRIGGTEASV